MKTYVGIEEFYAVLRHLRAGRAVLGIDGDMVADFLEFVATTKIGPATAAKTTFEDIACSAGTVLMRFRGGGRRAVQVAPVSYEVIGRLRRRFCGSIDQKVFPTGTHKAAAAAVAFACSDLGLEKFRLSDLKHLEHIPPTPVGFCRYQGG